jgi:hypothetical protein
MLNSLSRGWVTVCQVFQGEGEFVLSRTCRGILKIEKRPMLPFRDPGKPKEVDDIEIFARLPNIELNEVANLETVVELFEAEFDSVEFCFEQSVQANFSKMCMVCKIAHWREGGDVISQA